MPNLCGLQAKSALGGHLDDPRNWGTTGATLNRAERRAAARRRREWLTAITQDPGVSPGTREVARLVVQHTDADGTITDPILVRLLREIDEEANDGK